jgi:protein with PEP-CTERM/exosortase system signal
MNSIPSRAGKFQCHRTAISAAMAVIIILSCSGRAKAIPIGIDLGPSPSLTSHTSAYFDALDGISLEGQTLSINFRFTNSEFARLFTVTSRSFKSLLTLQTSGSGVVGFLHGTGFLVDQHGNALETPQDLGSASSNDGSLHAGLFPFFSGELNTPVDFFGVHFDLTLPNRPWLTITGSDFGLISDPGHVFGIGPGVPPDIVPDAGSTLLLLGISVTGLMAIKR